MACYSYCLLEKIPLATKKNIHRIYDAFDDVNFVCDSSGKKNCVDLGKMN